MKEGRRFIGSSTHNRIGHNACPFGACIHRDPRMRKPARLKRYSKCLRVRLTETGAF